MKQIKKIIGINISQVREKRGYTQSELASLCNLGKSTIRNIELGIDGISIPKLYLICDVLRCDILNILPSSEIYYIN